jgi:hypothetical protein
VHIIIEQDIEKLFRFRCHCLNYTPQATVEEPGAAAAMLGTSQGITDVLAARVWVVHAWVQGWPCTTKEVHFRQCSQPCNLYLLGSIKK